MTGSPRLLKVCYFAFAIDNELEELGHYCDCHIGDRSKKSGKHTRLFHLYLY